VELSLHVFVVPGCLQNLFTRLSFDEQQRQSNHEHVGLLIRNLSVGELRFSILKIHSIRSICAIRSCSHTSPFLLQIDEKLFEINRRPREKLNFLTPNEVFFKHYL
jgi:hypothetical protein